MHLDLKKESEKVKYLSYLLDRFIDLEKESHSFFSDRDIKLEILLNTELDNVKKDLDSNIEKIKSKIHSILYKTKFDTEFMEKMASDISDCLNYLEYLKKIVIKKED